MTRVVVFAWGNASRGDDGIGPAIADRLAAAALPGVDVVEDYQLQLEHALDLGDADIALFVDAGRETPAPFSLTEIAASDDASAFSHALSPETVLGVYRRISGGMPPPAFALAVRGEHFELGAALSGEVAGRVEAATAMATALCRNPTADAWRRAARSISGES